MGRSSWHYDHPPACTCVSCVEKRRSTGSGGIIQMIKDLVLFKKFRRKG